MGSSNPPPAKCTLTANHFSGHHQDILDCNSGGEDSSLDDGEKLNF